MTRHAIHLLLIVLLCLCSTGQAADTPVSPPASSTTAPVALPYRGGTIRIDRVDWIDRYKTTIDEIAAIGSDTVCLIVNVHMENGRSNMVWLDQRMTPSPDALAELIRHAKSRRLRVILLPTLLLQNPEGTDWRGTIDPRNWNKWFDSYREALMQFAWVAQGCDVDVLSVGCEMVSSEEKVEQWHRTIAEVREVFKGQLTYQANWDHYSSIPFWDHLDMVGMNSYWILGHDRNVRVEDIKRRWTSIKDDLLAFQKQVNKPVIFTEAGWHSLPNAAAEPWDYTKVSQDPDLGLQKRLFQGFFEVWHGTPFLGGIIIYEWSPDAGGPTDQGYTPRGKPAEAVIHEWFSKPRWEVHANRGRSTTRP